MLTHHQPDIIVVDNFYVDPDFVRHLALSQEFIESDYHKGKRTIAKFCFPGVKERLEYLLQKRITVWDEHRFNGVFQYCIASDPIVIHSDLQTYAAVVYLTPNAPPECGTTFYRSKKTGLMASPTEADAKRANMSLHDLNRMQYSGNLFDFTKWEVIDVIGNVYNRLVIWNAKLIHSASMYFGNDVADSRLFHMFFFDAE